MQNWYQMEGREVLEKFGSTSAGLESREIPERQEKYGKNVLEGGEKESVLRIFLGQFADIMVVILMAAAVISMFTGDVESTIVIFAVLILNAALGTLQEVKAQKSLEALKALSSPSAKVMRNGEKIEVDSSEIVPGDVMILEAGDMVTADGRILESFSLQLNESSLTGESTNVEKTAEILEGETALADQKNMVHSGSLVTYGRALVCVTETGMETEIGRIAKLMNDTKEKKTPLQVAMDNFSKWLATAILLICLAVFALEMLRGMELIDSLLFAVALAVAAIPEALSSIITICQAMGTQKMAKENAIIKNLSAVESLGCVSVICSDKTGTLTQNKMTVQKIYTGGEILEVEDLQLTNQLHRYLLYDAVLDNDSSIVDGKGIGDPTEYALLSMYRKVNGIINEDAPSLSEDLLREFLERKDEVPFDSDRKLMSTQHDIHGVSTVFTKGAVDVLLDRCISIRTAEGVRPITEEDKNNIREVNRSFSEEGLRVLAFAYFESEEDLSVETEDDYIFLGLISMMDPPREESREAVAAAAGAGIRTVMITGDHKITATSIAKQIGIFREGDLALTGMELDRMSDEEFAEKIEKISVYARVSPENKIRIVDAWQKKGKIVSMTGDGVNDAPALKKADIGVAMGITGTEVSKDAASMILADDNFATIIKAVANGRTIFRNIRNAVLFLLSGNLSAIITVLFTSIAALPIPFRAVQLLFINLVTDSLPALAIGMEPGERNVLRQKPRDPDAGIMDRKFVLQMVLQGLLISASVITAYLIGLQKSPALACSMAFTTLTLARLFHGFNCRGDQSIFSLGFGSNLYSLGAFALGCLLVALVLFVPVVSGMFSVAEVTMGEVGIIALLAFQPTMIIQLVKTIVDSVNS